MLTKRVERLKTIPAVGPITALTWVLEMFPFSEAGHQLLRTLRG